MRLYNIFEQCQNTLMQRFYCDLFENQQVILEMEKAVAGSICAASLKGMKNGRIRRIEELSEEEASISDSLSRPSPDCGTAQSKTVPSE